MQAKILVLAVLLSFGLMAQLHAQTPGLIYDPASSPGNTVLDPDGDGFVSVNINAPSKGFVYSDQTESEIPYQKMIFPGAEPVADLTKGPSGGFSDFVDSGVEDPAQYYLDASNNLMFRLRIGSSAPNSKGYSILIDTDQKFGFTGPNADPTATTSNPGFEVEINLQTNFGVYVYNVDGGCPGAAAVSHTGHTNYQKSFTLSTITGTRNSFYDFYVPFSDLEGLGLGITSSTPLRMIIITQMNPSPALCNNATSDLGGVDDSACGSLFGCLLDIIDNYTPTSADDIQNGVTPKDRSDCPTLTGPVTVNSTSINGTTTELAGTSIQVYKNGASLGAPVITSVDNASWSLSGVSGLVAGDVITATATGPGEGASIANCSSKTVITSCTPPGTPALNAIGNGDKVLTGTKVTGTHDVYIYKADGTLLTGGITSNPFSASGTTLTYTHGTGGTKVPDGAYYVVISLSGCNSLPSAVQNNNCTASTTPTINTATIYESTTTISITGASGASLRLWINGVASNFTATGTGSAQNLTVSGLSASQSLTVVAVNTATSCPATSAAKVVQADPVTPNKPTISGSYCVTGTQTLTITGSSVDADGTSIQLFKNSVSHGSAVTVSSGAWSASGSFAAGDVITARATIASLTSGDSDPITVLAVNTNAVAITTDPIVEGSTSISGTGVDGDVIKLYVDDAEISGKTATVGTGTSGQWTITGIETYSLYAGAQVTVTATSGSSCESSPSAAVEVVCSTPATPSFSDTNLSYCYGSQGELTLSTSESLVIYEMVDNTGASIGQQSIGTGSSITLYTNALTSNLLEVYVKAFKLLDASCYVISSNSVDFDNQLPSPTIDLTSTNVDVVSGSTTASFTYTNPQNSSSDYSIAFPIAAENQGFADVSSTTLPSSPIVVTVPAAAASGTYTAQLTITGATACESLYNISITIYDAGAAASIATHPASDTKCSGESVSFSVSASNVQSYQWQLYNGSTYDNLSDGGIYSGVTSSNLNISDNTGLNANVYRVEVVGYDANPLYSNDATLTVVAIDAGTIGSNQTICSGDTPSLLTSISDATGTAVTYQWRVSNDGFSFTNISGATSSTYAPGSLTSTKYYLRKATSTANGYSCEDESNLVTITVTGSPDLSGLSTSASDECIGNNSTVTVSATNLPNGTYTVNYTLTGTNSQAATNTTMVVSSGNSGTFTTSSLPSAGTTNLTINSLTLSGCSTTASSGNTDAITVSPASVGGSISGGATVCSGTNSTTLTLSGHTGSITKWQSSTDNFASDINDIVNTTTSQTATNLTATTSYRAVITSGSCSSANSSTATVTVSPASVGGSISGGATVCSGTNSTTLTLSGHTGSITKWQSSTDNFASDINDIANTTTSQTATNLTATTSYRAVITSGSCSSANSSTSTVTVSPASVGGSISGGATVCSGTNSTTLTLSGHTGSITKWQSSTDNFASDINDIVNTTTSQTATNLTATTSYRAVITSGSCSSANSSTATVTVSPASVGGSISGGATVCSGTNSTTLTLSGHTGSITKWQSSTDNFASDINDIVNTTTSQTATNLTATTSYRAVITSGSCSSANSSTATVTVSPASVGGSISGGATVCSGTNSTTLTLSGHTGSITKWQSSTDNFASDINDIVNTTTSQTATNLTATTSYRAVITSGSCSSANSSTATVTVSPASVGGSISGGATVCSGTNSTTLTLSGHTGSITKWQSSTDNFASDINDIVNTTTSQTATNLTATTSYRAVITSGSCSSANSSTATVTVSPASVGGSISGGATVCSGTNSTTLTLSGHTGSITKWQSSTDNFASDINDIVNTTTSQTATNLTATTSYRAVITSGSCSSANSSTATVTVGPGSVGGSISGGATVCSGTNSTTLTLSGHTGSITKWQSSTDNFASDINDIVNTTTSQTATNLTATTSYRAVITSGSCSSANSSTATVTVSPASVGGSISGGATVCSGTNSTTLTLSGHTGSITKWQSSTDNFASDINDIVNTTTSQTATNLTATTSYRAVITSGSCSSANSSTATVTVSPGSVGGSISGGATVCSGTNSTTLTLSGHTGSITKWQSSTDNFASDINDIVNTTTSQTATNLTATTSYRAVITSGSCSSANSSTSTVTVSPASVGGSISGGATVCSGTNSTTLTLSGHTGSITKWQSSTDNFASDINDIVNTTTSQTATNLTATTSYRAVITSGSCSSANSSTATVTVVAQPTEPTVNSQVTNNTEPIISGNADSGNSITVVVGGATYVTVANASGNWSIDTASPNSGSFSPNTNGVNEVVVGASNGSCSRSDATTNELTIDTTAPSTVPTVVSQTTNDTTPTITGTATVGAGETLTVTVDGVTYTAGDGNLTLTGTSWSLTIPGGNAITTEGAYAVTATVTDAAGNSTSDATTNELTLDTTAPSTVPTVVSQTTNDTTPTITGTATVGAGETLMVTVDGVTYTAGDGNLTLTGTSWSLTIPGGNAITTEGAYAVTATVTDAAGNSTSDATTNELTLDTTAPSTVPTVVSQTTNDTTPTITGTATVGAGETLTVTVDGVTYTAGDGNLVDNGDGTWSLTIPAGDALAENTYSVTATVTDAAGNSTSDATTNELTLDTTAPSTVPTVVSQTTNDTTPTITGTATVGAGETLTVTVDGVTYTAGDGNLTLTGTSWSLTIPGGNAITTEGAYAVTATVTDAAGNSTSDATTNELTIDTTAPSTVPTVVSQTTNDTTPTITGTATVGAGETLTVTVDGVTYTAGDGNLTLTGTSWSLTIPGGNAITTEGAYAVTATVTDAAGNSTSDATTNELTLDTTAPSTVPTVVSQTTNDTTPTITGTATVGAGETLTVTVDGVTYTAGDGNLTLTGTSWSLTIPGGNAITTEGAYAVTATVTDAAGNSTSDATTNELTIDTTAPSTVPTVVSQTTNDTTPTITGTATVGAGETLTVTVDGVTYTAGDGNLTLTGTSWSLTIPGGNAITTEGAYAVTATVTDAAGNSTSDATTNELTIDTTAPSTVPTVVSQTTNDTTPTITGTATVGAGETLTVTVDGVTYTAGDGNLTLTGTSWSLTIPGGNAITTEGAYAVTATVTDAAGNSTSDATTNELTLDTTAPSTVPTVVSQTTNDTTPTITGTATVGAGETLMVTVDGVTYTAGDGNLTLTGTSWSLTIPGGNAITTEGAYAVTATVTDAAGNSTSDATTNELTLDTTAPSTVPTVVSQTTNDTTPTITGTATVGAGETLTVTVDGVTYTAGDGNLVDNGDGTWSLTIPAGDALAENTYSVTATVTDAAGNSTSDATTNELTIDTTAPATAPTVTAQTTNDTTPTISGTATVGTGETLTVEVNSVTYTAGDGNLVDNGDGTWSLTIPAGDALAENTYPVTATVTDAAGNSTSDATTNELTLDTTAPSTVPTVVSQTTNDTTPTITGTATVGAGETLTVTVDGVTYTAGDGNMVDNGDGTWSLTIPAGDALAENTYSVTATVTDAAGNSTSDATTNELTIDTTAPSTVPTVVSQTTNDTTPTITGTATVGAGETLTVTVDGVTYTAGDGNLVDNGDGTWSLTIPAGDALAENTYSVTATVTDAAGNSTSDATTGELIVNTSILAPTGESSQSFCTADNPTIANLVVTGSNIKWYSNPTGGSPLSEATSLVSGTKYYASQTVDGAESSERLEVTVTVNTTPTIALDSSNDPGTCSGTDGSLLLSFTNVPDGIYTLTYRDGSASDQTFDNVSVVSNAATIGNIEAGVYNDIAISVNGCTSLEDVDVTMSAPSPETISKGTTSDPSNCDVLNGSIQLIGLSANSSYTVNYTVNSVDISTTISSNASGTLLIRELGAGEYRNIFVVSQTNECQSNELSGSIVLEEPAVSTISVLSSTNPSACGTSDGVIILDGLLNSARYTVSYLYNGRIISGSMLAVSGRIEIENLSVGYYSNFKVKISGCESNTISESVVLTDPASPEINLNSVNSTSSCNASDGVIKIGGLIPGSKYTYEYTYVGRILRSTQSITASGAGIVEISGLSAGIYQFISLTNESSGCQSNTIESAEIKDTGAPEIALGTTGDPTVCDGSDGFIRLTGLSADREYGVSFLVDDLNVTTTLTSNGSGVIEITGLRSGTYKDFTVNRVGCVSNQLSAVIDLDEPVTPVISVTDFANPSICGEADGWISLGGTIPDGSYNVQYDFNGSIMSSVIASSSGVLLINNLSAGSYQNFSIELSGCSSNIVRSPISLNDPGSPEISFNSQLNPTSCASFDGFIKLSGLTPSVSYNYAYFKNGVEVTSDSPLLADAGGVIEISNLTSGSYSNLSVSESGSNCRSNTIETITLNPPDISIWAYVHPTTCNGTDGKIEIEGLTPGVSYTLSYRINSGAEINDNIVADSWGNYALEDLSAGDYSDITVEIDGCISNALSVDLNSPDNAVIALENVTVPLSCEADNGSIKLTGLEVSTDYELHYTSNSQKDTLYVRSDGSGYILISNLAPGEYTSIYVISKECQSNTLSSVIVGQAPEMVIVSVNAVNPTTCGGMDGNLALTFQDIPDGSYSITYSDENLNEKVFSGVSILSGSANISGLTAGSYNDLRVIVGSCKSTGDIDASLSDLQFCDTDGDGVSDAEEDIDGDGDPDNDDTDGDGTPDYLDTDDDGDGILTEDEDTDGDGDPTNDDCDTDGTPNYLDSDPCDTDGDGLDDSKEDTDGDGNPYNDDCDGDGTPNFQDPDVCDDGTDTDGDGVTDVEEDLDGDGDPDNDDTDGDGTPDYLDTDDDGDGILTEDEDTDGDGDPTNDDCDADGTPNYLDSDPCDTDGDGLDDSEEDTDGDGNPYNDDCDGDGTPNFQDPDVCDDGTDTDGDGVTDAEEDIDGDGDPDNDDSDGDGTPDYLDTDDDGDGILTEDEDTDGDGDPTNDDCDADGTPNYLDSDPCDTDGDGLDDSEEDTDGDGNPYNDDCDGDGTPNFQDPDVCDDGTDTDGDGVTDAEEDIDGDGDPDNDDTDGDGTPDYLDTDDDGDGILTEDEDIDGDGDPTNDDCDGDGTPNYLDSDPCDTDGDGLNDTEEDTDGDGNPYNDDCDGDGTPNFQDGDSCDTDGDGILDEDEDTDGDGDPTNDDCDADGTPNYLDSDPCDTDGDGLNDNEEDTNGDGNPYNDDCDGDGTPNFQDDDSCDTDGDGVLDSDEDVNGDGDPTNDDSDGDGTPDYLDTDDDGDGIDTKDEDTNDDGDPRNDDCDDDGAPNYLDTDQCAKVEPRKGFTPDGDGINDFFYIKDIENYPNNTVQIFNRWGNKVFEIRGYDNQNNVWASEVNSGLRIGTGNNVPSGTYYYLIQLGDGSDAISGFVVVNR